MSITVTVTGAGGGWSPVPVPVPVLVPVLVLVAGVPCGVFPAGVAARACGAGVVSVTVLGVSHVTVTVTAG